MRISVLASGSAGNLLVVATGRTWLLVDAGLGPREFARRVARLPRVPSLARAPRPRRPAGTDGIDPALLPDALFLTHEHGDHARCAGAYADLGVDVYATDGTRRELGLPGEEVRRVEPGVTQVVGDLAVETVALPHDAAEPVGYVISDGVSRVGVIVDCGAEEPEVARRYAGVDVLVLEFNHDPQLLQSGPYPPWLKRRIAGERGHLSNAQAAALLRNICRAGRPPKLVVLAHLSHVNNRPGLALRLAGEVMRRPGRVVVAPQDQPTPWLDPAAPDGRAVDALRGEQLVLRLVSG